MKSLRRTLLALVAVIALPVMATMKQDIDYFVYTSLLLNGNTEDIRLAARAMGREKISDEDLLDVVAVTLWRNRHKRYTDEEIDTLSWLAKDLGMSANARYRGVLQRCQTEFASNKKLKNYIDEALTKLAPVTNTSTTVFEPEAFDEASKRARIQALRERYPAKSNNTPLQASESTSLEAIVTEYGLPPLLDSVVRRESAGHFASWYASYLRFWYPNFGGVRFTYEKDDKAGWLVLDQWPIVTTQALNYSGADWGLAYSMWTTDPILLRETAKNLYTLKGSNTAILDVVADRLWLSLTNPDPKFADAYAWLCRLLEQSRSKRYESVLRDLVAQSADKKIVRFAENALEALDRDAPRYERSGAADDGQLIGNK